MRRSDLEHVLRAAGAVTQCREFVIVGSQTILGEYPDAPTELRVSRAVDIYPLDVPALAELIDGTLGEGSPFDTTFGSEHEMPPLEELLRYVALIGAWLLVASASRAQSWAPLRFCDRGERVSWIGLDGNLWSWRWRTKELPKATRLTEPPLLDAFLGPGCRMALVHAVRDRTREVRVVDVHTGEARVLQVPGAGNPIAFAVDDEHGRIAWITESEVSKRLVWLDAASLAVTGETKLAGMSASMDAIEVTSDGRVILGGSGRYACIVTPGDSVGDCRYGTSARGLGAEDDIRSVALAPDGKVIALGTLGHEVLFRSVGGDQRDVQLVPNGGRPLSGHRPRFSPTGSRVLVVQTDRVLLYMVGSDAPPLQMRSDRRPRAAVFAPDGHHVAVLYAGDEISVWTADVAPSMHVSPGAPKATILPGRRQLK